MDVTLFENKFVREKETVKEIYKYWFFGRPIMICVYVLLGVYALSILLGLIFDPAFAGEFLVPFILLIFTGFLMLISYCSQVKTMNLRDEELARGRELFCEISVTDSEIIHSVLENQQSVSIASIKYAFITKNYEVVVSKAQMMYIVKKDSFTVGDADSFISFLRGKGVKIKK